MGFVTVNRQGRMNVLITGKAIQKKRGTHV